MTAAAERFEAFGGEHFALLGLFLAGAVGIVAARAGRSAGPPRPGWLLQPGRWRCAIPCVTVPSQVFQLTPGPTSSLGSSLPLQLCDLAWMTAVWALWTHGRVPVGADLLLGRSR